MDLDQPVTISPPPRRNDWYREQMSFFEAVRRWSDSEGDHFDIHINGVTLTARQIRELTASKPYLDMLLAFDERRKTASSPLIL